MYHHQVGISYHFDGPGVDIGQVVNSCSSLESDYDKANTLNTALAMHGVALEEGATVQISNNPSANATRLVNEAVSQGQKIYTADSTNWTSDVRPNLVNYASGDLDNIENWYINAGWNVFIPEDGATAFDWFTGYGYLAVPIAPYSGTVGIITGSLKGLLPASSQGESDTDEEAKKKKQVLEKDRKSKSDPIGSFRGNLLLSSADISVGSLQQPYLLEFSRYYDSDNRLVDGPLGLGWKHGYDITAFSNSDGFRGFAHESPVEAAAAITEMFVSVQILADQTRPLNKYLSLLIANQWLMNQLKGNVVQVSMPDTVLTFTKLPDGSYAAPRTNSSELVLASGEYTLTTAQGVEYSFDTDGNIDEIVYPFGVTVSFTYTSGRLTSVSNGMGRTLTLSYTGDRLTSVSDGNGRTVQYSVNGSNELVTFTDANGEDTTYDYNGDGRLTQIFYPANPLVAFVTNTYDSLGRVMEQEDPAQQSVAVLFCRKPHRGNRSG
ncbi:MAG: RHS repeat protein [Candidatus Competibacteraceae bacterium]|nr:RHS repeat protein [Candidatus Competibacteraceae bacterium]